MRGLSALAVLGVIAALVPAPAWAFDADQTFAKGTVIFSFQAGGGGQNNVEDHGTLSDVLFTTGGPRLSRLFLDPIGPAWFRWAFETGIEGWLQYYVRPEEAMGQGLKLALRHHFLSFGPLVPYLELTVGGGASDLEVLEIRSTFNFVAEGGAGFSIFVTDGLALTGGYRFQHISNGDVERPNRGFNSHIGTFGFSYFFR